MRKVAQLHKRNTTYALNKDSRKKAHGTVVYGDRHSKVAITRLKLDKDTNRHVRGKSNLTGRNGRKQT